MNKHYTFQEYIEKFSSIQDSYDYYFELQKENDELREDIGNYVKIVLHDRKEIERLHSIIKEVREYIESYLPNYDFDKTNLKKLLEILKGSDKE